MNANTTVEYHTKTKIFKTLKYNISDNNDILLDNSCDPDVKFFNKKFQGFDKPYLMPWEFHNFFNNSSDKFSVFHLNIRSIKRKNLKKNLSF